MDAVVYLVLLLKRRMSGVTIRVLVIENWNYSELRIPPAFNQIIEIRESDVMKFSPPLSFYDVIFSSVKSNLTHMYKLKVFCLGYTLCAEHCLLIGHGDLFGSSFIANDDDDTDDIVGVDEEDNDFRISKAMSKNVNKFGRICFLATSMKSTWSTSSNLYHHAYGFSLCQVLIL